MSSRCRTIGRCVESYLDGELGPSQVLEVEQHTEECATCRERIVLDRAIRAGVRRTVAGAPPSASLRSRVVTSMRAEREKNERWAQPAPLSGRSTLLLAAAAAAAAVYVFQQRDGRGDAHSGGEPIINAAQGSAGLDAMLDQFADWHARPLLPETTNANDLPRFEPYVGVPVHAPALSPFGARFLGGRILPMNDEHVTAMLQYTMAGGQRISIYVYDPHRLPTSSSRLHPRKVGSDPVYVGNVRGWSIAAAEKRGVGYAIASDLNDDESAELVLAAAPR
jgi:anti-sigma factor (TIGR02949 family)